MNVFSFLMELDASVFILKLKKKYPARSILHWRTNYRSVIINENLTNPQILNNKGDRVSFLLIFVCFKQNTQTDCQCVGSQFIGSKNARKSLQYWGAETLCNFENQISKPLKCMLQYIKVDGKFLSLIKAPQALHNTPPLLGAPKVILWDI